MLSGIALKVVFFWQSHSFTTHKTNAYCIHDISTVLTNLHIFKLAMFFNSFFFFFSVLGKKKDTECLSPYIDIAMSNLFLNITSSTEMFNGKQLMNEQMYHCLQDALIIVMNCQSIRHIDHISRILHYI